MPIVIFHGGCSPESGAVETGRFRALFGQMKHEKGAFVLMKKEKASAAMIVRKPF